MKYTIKEIRKFLRGLEENKYRRRYAIDAAKIENELGWKAAENFATGIEKTVDWYLKNKLEI